jgi:hypothetical protein
MPLTFRSTKDPNTIPPEVEAILRKELGLAHPISYQVEKKDMRSMSGGESFREIGKVVGKQLVKKVVPDVAGALAGTMAGTVSEIATDKVMDREKKPALELLCIIHFDIIQPRQAKLDAYVVRQNLVTCVGHLLYNCKLTKSVGSEVTLVQDEVSGTVEFKGDRQASTKLNNNTDFVRRASNFTRADFSAGAFKLRIVDARFKITPQPQGSLLVAHTTPSTSSFWGSTMLDAKSFFGIVTLLEALL